MFEKYKGDDLKEYANKLKKTVSTFNPSYKLVRGANWYDKGDILNGAEKKTFVSQDSAYSTIGFRYVIRFKEKQK